MGINEYEGDNFVLAHTEIKEKFCCKTRVVKADGKYATYRNIARGFGKGIDLKYKIQKGRGYNEIVPGARMEYKLSFLLKMGVDDECVGAYLINLR